MRPPTMAAIDAGVERPFGEGNRFRSFLRPVPTMVLRAESAAHPIDDGGKVEAEQIALRQHIVMGLSVGEQRH